MFRLPVSGLEVALRQPAGVEDLLLAEAPSCNIELALALLARLAQPVDGAAVDWGALSITDFEALLLLIRRIVFGDAIRANVNCPVEGCGARIDVSFSIGDYLARHKPGVPRGVERSGEPSWFQLKEEPVKFRLPSAADLADVAGHVKPERELVRRCLQPADVTARVRRRVEAAMESLAPPLSRELRGECPECHTMMAIYFDVPQFVLRELRDQAAFVYQDVHLLALHYKWHEDTILALPRDRRIQYAETLRQEGGSA